MEEIGITNPKCQPLLDFLHGTRSCTHAQKTIPWQPSTLYYLHCIKNNRPLTPKISPQNWSSPRLILAKIAKSDPLDQFWLPKSVRGHQFRWGDRNFCYRPKGPSNPFLSFCIAPIQTPSFHQNN